MEYRQLLVSVDLQHDVSYLLQRASKLRTGWQREPAAP